MMRTLQLFCSSLLLITLASCANKTPPVETSTAPPAAPVTTTTVATKSPGFIALEGVVAATKKAIESGKLDAAKTEFAKFEDAWKTVEDGIKSKSPETYRSIEDGVKSIEKGIKSNQDKNSLLASLEKLSQTIDRASK